MKSDVRKVVRAIGKPTDLGKKYFEFPTNRDSGYSEDLAESMRIYGFVDPVKVIKTDLLDGVEKLYILDGHHRVKTASFMGIPYSVDILDNKFSSRVEIVHFMTTLNSSQRPWHVNDYVRVYSKLGLKSYIDLIELKAGTPFSFYALSMVLSRMNKSNLTELLKSGSFYIERFQEGKRVVEFAKELSRIGRLSNRMLLSLNKVMMLDNFNKKKFIDAYKKYHFSLAKMRLDNFDDLFTSWLEQ